jgi:hypothetical protein
MPVSLPTVADPGKLLANMRELLLVGAGLAPNARLDAFVRLRDLRDAGIVNVGERYLAGGPVSGPGGSTVPIVEPAIDRTPPPVPSGFSAVGGKTQILFATAAPVYRQGHGHSRTKIYAAPVGGGPLPTFADAVLYTDFPGNIGVAPFDPASSLRLWATWTSADGIESLPAGGTNGIAAATGLLEDQHIATLSVGKLLAGSLSVGQYIQSSDYVAATSGWRIQTLSGGSAFLEINGGAKIGGAVIGSNFIQSANYSLNVAGWRLSSTGTGQIGGFAVGNDYIQSTNYVAGTTGWRLTNDGQILTHGFTLTAAGVATFSGALSAATGTFAGALSAATGTFAGSLSAATGTFAGSLSAASGTFAGSLTAQVVDTANIVGAAVTSTYSSTAGAGTPSSVSLTPPSGTTALVCLFYGGFFFDTTSGTDQPWSVSLFVNGTNVKTAQSMGMHVILSPSGGYTIQASASGGQDLVVMVCKR